MFRSQQILKHSLFRLNCVSIPSNHIKTLLLFQRRLQSTAATLGALNTNSLAKSYEDPTIPSLPFRWFYAIDVPITMPPEYNYVKTDTPKKFSAFSERDSKSLEKAYQKLFHDRQEAIDKNFHKVPVNEDLLFEVDLEKKEMYPVYWPGAVYEVRRGTWFNDEGQPLREELAEELEKGYLKLRPFEKISSSVENPLTKKDDYYELKDFKEGKLVVYGEDRTAYILEELAGGTFQLSLLKKLESGPALGGTRVLRGFKKSTITKNVTEKSQDKFSSLFELQLSQILGEKSGLSSNKATELNTMNAMEIEIDEDYNVDEETAQEELATEREIDHLILCVHGIGQVLGTKFQGVDFVHTINLLRKNIKSAYNNNKDLQNLLPGNKNSRIQVVPITWRHKVSFKPDEAPDDLDANGNRRLPSLLDITVDEIKPMRNLLGSVVLDVLLYYEPKYFNEILDEVVKQANHVYATFKERNPNFSGKVSFIGHSLGSSIVFDILALQPTKLPENPTDPKHLSFAVKNYFSLGSPTGVFNLLRRKNIGSRELNGESTDKMLTPRVENYYNIFHPCDPVGYRCEPLISNEFRDFQPESVPYLIEDFNKQISNFAEYGESLHNKIITNTTEAWKNLTSTVNTSSINLSNPWKLVDQARQIGETNVKEELASKKDDVKEVTKEIIEKAEEKLEEKAEEKLDATKRSVKLTPEQLKKLTGLNYNGRVDYALTQGYFDLSVVSAISAHVNYFEDENTAAFILRETLTKQEPVKEKKARLLNLDK